MEITSIRKFLFSFSGREGRKVFIIGYLSALTLLCVFAFLFGFIVKSFSVDESFSMVVLGFLSFPVLGFIICLAVRRLHDIGFSGWWYLAMVFFNLVPFLGRVLTLIFLVMLASIPGDKQDNKYGEAFKPSNQST